jgi:CBS domain-containing protein
MKKQNDIFLTTYKALEKELTDMGLSIKDYEDRLVNDGNTDAADKLRLCRMIRNYLSHHADGDELVTVNNNLSAFIKGLIIMINNTKLKAKDSYVPVSRSKRLIRKPESVRDIIDEFNKHPKENILYVISGDNKLLGQINSTDVLGVLYSISRLSDLKKTPADNLIKKANVVTVDKDTVLSDIKADYCIVMKNKDEILGETSCLQQAVQV